MKPAAHLQSAIEILDSIIASAGEKGAPADRLLAEWFKSHRFAGSKDKRAIRELVYAAIRACGPVPENGRAAILRLAEIEPELLALFDDDAQYGPGPIKSNEAPAKGGIAPQWLTENLGKSDIAGAQAAALLERAPLDLRVNSLKVSREALDLPVEMTPLAAPDAIRIESGTNVDQWDAYDQGLIEVQDLGSQIAALAAGAQPGETVIDLCAGAGGKTLALAAAMKNQGTLIAADTDRGRLSRLPDRAMRAGVTIAETVLLNPGKELQALAQWQGKADRVLIDAPCSGTGTWRRNPEARWRLTPKELRRLTDLQDYLLGIAAGLLRPGGVLTYITCSLLDEEGPDHIADILERHPGWAMPQPELPLGTPRGPGTRLTPAHDGTDGFFIACISKP